MFFAKGEIKMNNIYKVIWSKAKNCYVVASEIARSHTKSASGSEKIGGVTRRSLLASLMALSLLCGGLGVASAADVVHVDESATGTAAVYTTAKVDTLLNDKADETAVTTALDGKANTSLNNLDDAGKSVIKDTMAGELAKKADATALDTKANKETTLAGYGITDAYTKADVDNAVAGAVATAGTNVDAKLADYAKTTDVYNKAEVDGKIADEENARNTAINTAITQERHDRTTAIDTAINGEVTNRNQAINTAIELEKTNRDAAISTAKAELQGKITAEETARKEADTAFNNRLTTAEGKIGNNTTAIGDLKAKDIDLEGKITKNSQDIATLDGKVTTAQGDIQTNANNIQANSNAIADTNKRTGGIARNLEGTQTTIEGKVTVNNNGDVGGVKGLSAETITTTGNADLKGNVILGTNAANMVTVNGKADFNEAVNMDNGLTVTNGDTTLQKTNVNGALNVTGESNLKNTTVGGTLDVTGATTLKGTLIAEKDATFEKNVTVQNDLTVDGTLNTKDVTAESIHISKSEDTPSYKSEGSIIGEGGNLSVSNKKTDKITNITEESQLNVNEKGTVNWATSTDNTTGNVTEGRSEVTADNIKNSVKKTEGGKTFGYEENITETGKVGTASDKDGNKNELTQTATGTENTVTSKDGNKSTTKQEAGSISSTVYDKDGNVKASSEMKEDGSISNNATGNISNTAKNVTNEGNESVTNKVGANEVKVSTNGVDIKAEAGKKITESVGTASRVVENAKITDKAADSTVTTENGKGTTFGKEGSTGTGTTNIYGDSIKTGTINAEDTTTAKLTAGAAAGADGGRLTVDANDGVKGSYKSGDYTSRSYILANTLKSGVDNGKEPTDADFVGSRTDHYMDGDKAKLDETVKDAAGSNVTNKTSTGTVTTITDGNGKTSATIQDVKNLAGSVTNGTETGVSGIHANDDGSVSIDSAVAGGGMYSVINQKKDSIQSAVGDGTNSTVIHQDKDNVTIASSNGMVGLFGKDIVNNAQDTITNTAGTSITNQVNDSKVTTDANGTTFENNTPAVSDGGATTTKINGNQITTGRVDANELGVSDKDDQGNTADFSVKAGEGIKGSATDKDGNKTYTKVTATENSFQVQDKDGNIKNHQVNTKDKSENTIKNGDKTNTVTSTADGTTFNNSKANTAFEGGTYTDTTINGNTITTGQVKMDYAEVMKNLGVHGSAKVDNNLEVGGTTTTKTLNVTENATVGGTLDVTQKATFHDAVDIAKDLSVGGNATIAGDVTANSYKVGDKTYIDKNGIHANGQKITDVADGSISEGSKDAVNGGQLYDVKRDMEHKVDKVGANAAAMANLRPMEFDPSSKWNIAAAIGNYGSETAAALGAFYRPNDDVMVNLSTAFGTGENMVGGGVSVRLGKGGNKLSREENNALKDQVNDLTARMDALLSVLNPNMSKDFPDVPENHWAYEAVSRLAGNDIVQGYPDGEFHGERTMTRYEMAEIIYNALSRGAEAEKELVEEFKPELQAMAASEKATAERAEG